MKLNPSHFSTLSDSMSVFQTWTLNRTLSRRAFEELCFLWQQLLVKGGEQARILTEERIKKDSFSTVYPQNHDIGQKERFRLFLTDSEKLLLVGEPLSDTQSYQVTMTCDRAVIDSWFLRLHIPALWLTSLENTPSETDLISRSSPLSLDLPSYLLNQILEIVARDAVSPPLALASRPKVLIPSEEEKVSPQVAQERLLNQVIAQIRHSLELSTILETAVQEVRSLLQVDRLVIYQFDCQSPSPTPSNPITHSVGKITYEARISNAVPSVLNISAEDECFIQSTHYKSKFRQGNVVAVADVASTYLSSYCLAEFLNQYWIRSKLVAPIVVEGELWGLVIAHQCYQKRQWLPQEEAFLGKIGEHLAVAIFQAQLYAQVQQQKNTFEQRVIERTQELRETLIAAHAASQSKNAFLGNMSHELRTPLTCIIGLSGTLLHWAGESQALPLAKQQQYLQIIQDSGKHLLEIINDILEFSQLEAGKAALNIQAIDLRQFSQRIIRGFEQEAQQKNIHLSLDFQVTDPSPLFWTDADRLQQILLHLIHNGLKFTPESGAVTLRIWREQTMAVFQLEDTGIGIPEHQLPLLFEQFQQLEKSLQRTYGGTGLGLALTKQLVELHGGIIEVESSLGEGSIFTVRLPNQFQKKFPKAPTLAQNAFTDSANRSVILLMQEEEGATLICELLTAANYQVIWLADSSPSLRRIELLKPILVMIDRDLPNAFTISQDLKKSPVLRSLKLLLFSQTLNDEDLQAFAQYGIDDYLPKPIEPNRLLQHINELSIFDEPDAIDDNSNEEPE